MSRALYSKKRIHREPAVDLWASLTEAEVLVLPLYTESWYLPYLHGASSLHPAPTSWALALLLILRAHSTDIFNQLPDQVCPIKYTEKCS